jgi:hypothetical protein
MVLLGYGIATAAALLFSGFYVLVIPNEQLLTSPGDRALFPALTVVLTLFLLQDWVLIGIRQSRWVPLEQLLFASAKLGLLAVLAGVLPVGGIVLAWAVPALIAVTIGTPLLLLRVLPRQPEPGPGGAQMPSRRGLGIIFLSEYATGITTIVVPMLLPLIVVAQLGTEANAYYALPWMISEAVNLLLWNIYSSYMVEASNEPARNAALMRRTFKLAWGVGLVATPALLIGAPWVLQILGTAYADQGTDLLRLMALAVPFTIFYSMYISVSRVRQTMGRVVTLQVLTAITIIVLSIVLLEPLGVLGVGVAYLGARVVGSVVVAYPLTRIILQNRRELAAERSAAETAATARRAAAPQVPVTEPAR